ncbi:hypothetical protein NIES970_14830 [[Synechococcus] sp. NIES-970]|uniref:hypothetical protein n=1 Tax=Picosynechococcus sp. NKBG15041c TaxID=1407650 RepID=UPI0004202315|nr:hypothetical protein [Picosynechococcus sp. NKBG15041c]BAW96550.1 hypothetical protein NIES970_14830 [[Synechococcus] sp. NIES-970]
MIQTETVEQIHPERLPFLESICWQTHNVYKFTPEQMLSRYERGWRYKNIYTPPQGEELKFVKKLARRYHSWLQTQL